MSTVEERLAALEQWRQEMTQGEAPPAVRTFPTTFVAPPPAESGEESSLVEAIRAVYDAPEHATYPLDVATRLALKAEEEVATLRAQLAEVTRERDRARELAKHFDAARDAALAENKRLREAVEECARSLRYAITFERVKGAVEILNAALAPEVKP